MSRIACVLASIAILGIAANPAAAQVVKREPAMGALKPGQRVLVDDGSCGPGKIKEVIGGDHKLVGGRSNILRQRRCIAR
ncbi:MAG TPA: DUF6719 family protein [Xanthobacteraceae bacterium]|nr:DUF6719 family protein [Xanthobacteraceae bacterium]